MNKAQRHIVEAYKSGEYAWVKDTYQADLLFDKLPFLMINEVGGAKPSAAANRLDALAAHISKIAHELRAL